MLPVVTGPAVGPSRKVVNKIREGLRDVHYLKDCNRESSSESRYRRNGDHSAFETVTFIRRFVDNSFLRQSDFFTLVPGPCRRKALCPYLEGLCDGYGLREKYEAATRQTRRIIG